MRIQTICFKAFLLLLVLALGLFAQSSSNYSPLDPEGQTIIIAPPPQEEPTPPSSKVYTVPRKQVLIEGFTRTGCPYCPYAAVAEDRLKKERGDSVAVVNYHTSGSKDPFYNADGGARISYYGVQYVPTSIFNGIKWIVGGGGGTYNQYRDTVNQQMTVNTPGILSLKVTYNPTTRAGKIYSKFNSVDQIVEPSLHLRYVITESHLHYHWQNQDSLQFIERDMFPSASGVAFSINQGETFVDSQTFFVNSAWVDINCDLDVFVQSDVATYLKKVLISNEIPLYQRHVSGDANGDRTTTVSDVVFLMNYLFFHGPQPYPSASGDPNEDCATDVGDITYLINYLFKGGPAPLRGWEID